MRVLVVGGTQFVGRHLVEAAIAADHEVTLFHRGRTNDELFPHARHLHADRDGDLSILADGVWDATVDCCAYVPEQVERLAAALDGRGGHHLFVSTVSVYADPPGPGATEEAQVVELADPTVRDVTGETYGGLKVLCERAAATAYGDALTVVRPTYVVGPHDPTGRFTWWVLRMAAGGEVLAPGPADDPAQVIDARDMARWMVGLLEGPVAGTFHAVSPEPPFTYADLLGAVADAVGPAETTLTWVDAEWLRATGQEPPLWVGGDADRWLGAMDPSAATKTGLSPRPLHRTVAETLAWARDADAPVPPGVGYGRDTEADLLRRWHAR